MVFSSLSRFYLSFLHSPPSSSFSLLFLLHSFLITFKYVIYHEKVAAAEAIQILRQARQVIDPNPSFLLQLDNYFNLISTTTVTTTTSSIPPPSSSNNHDDEVKEVKEVKEVVTSSAVSSTPSSSSSSSSLQPVIESHVVEEKQEDGSTKIATTEVTTIHHVAPASNTSDNSLLQKGEVEPKVEPFKTVTHEGPDGQSSTTLIVENH